MPAARLRKRLLTVLGRDRLHDLVPLAGHSAGLIHDLPGAADIIDRIVGEAVAALSSTNGFSSR